MKSLTMKLCDIIELLENKKILFVEHCGINNSTGAEDAFDAAKPHHIGVCFYHSQDTDSAKETGEVYLHFYSTNYDEVGDEGTAMVGDIIFGTIRDAGFNVSWNGNADKRILVKNLDKEYFNQFSTGSDSDYESDWGIGRNRIVSSRDGLVISQIKIKLMDSEFK